MNPSRSNAFITSLGFRIGYFLPILANHNGLCTDKLSFYDWLAILKQHFDHFMQVVIQFVKCFSLSVRTGEIGNITNIKPCVRTFFYHCGKEHHPPSTCCCDLPASPRGPHPPFLPNRSPPCTSACAIDAWSGCCVSAYSPKYSASNDALTPGAPNSGRLRRCITSPNRLTAA